MAKAQAASTKPEIEELVVAVFRLNGALLQAGDQLMAKIGLTSARWQVMGAITSASEPLTVAGIARCMGLTRQNVRVIVRDLQSEGLVRLLDNPRHKRARLVLLTAKGVRVCASAVALGKPFTAELEASVTAPMLTASREVLQTLLATLEQRKHKEEL